MKKLIKKASKPKRVVKKKVKTKAKAKKGYSVKY
tara:strand:- start:28535 stop:28636 length:102 start_codon:yes stop_codon:yes gene_type:complete